MKKSVMGAVLGLAMVGVLGICGCGSSQKATTSSSDSAPAASSASKEGSNSSGETVQSEKGNYKIMLTSYQAGAVWSELQFSGVEKAAKELGVEVNMQCPATYPDLAAQVQIVETAVADGYNAILVHPVDSEGICETLQAAAAKNIAIFIVDTQVANQEGTIAFFGSDNYNMGVMAADEMAKAIGEKGQVAILGGNEAALAHSLRLSGMTDTFASKYPNIEVVDIQFDNVDALKANQMASSFMLSYPELSGIMATGEVGVSGILSAIEEGNAGNKYTVVAMDSGAKTNAAIRSGIVLGSVMQNPTMMGYLSTQAAVAYLKDGTKPAEYINDTGAMFVTSENIETEDAKAVMYE